MSNLESTALELLASATFCVSTAIACVALLRLPVRRHIGALAALRLWWILPLVPLVYLVPKTYTVTLVEALTPTPLMAGPIISAAASMNEAAPVTLFEFWPLMILWVWLVGVVITLMHLAWRQRKFMQAIHWPQGRHGVLPTQTSPAMVGVLSPRLVLPADFKLRYSAAEQRLIRLHEAIHRLRRDGLANLFMAVLLALQWFNPLVHWAARALCSDQESACDALVIERHPRQRRAYCLALLKSLASAQTYLPIACRWKAHHPTIERISMLKSHSRARVHGAWGTVMLSVGLFAASMLVYAARDATPTAPDAPRSPAATPPSATTSNPFTTQGPLVAALPTPLADAVSAPSSARAMSPRTPPAVPAAGEPQSSGARTASQMTPQEQDPKDLAYRARPPLDADEQDLPYLVIVESIFNQVDEKSSLPAVNVKKYQTQLLLRDNESMVLGLGENVASSRLTWSLHAKRKGDGLLIRTQLEEVGTGKVLATGEVLATPGETHSIRSGDDNRSIQLAFTLSKRVTAEELVEMRKPVGRCDQPSVEPGGPPTCRFLDEKDNPLKGAKDVRRSKLTIVVPDSGRTVRELPN